MNEVLNLWDYTDTPLTTLKVTKPLNYQITENTTIKQWKEKWEAVLKTNKKTIIYPFLQKTVDYLKSKEIKILSNYDVELYDREIIFKGIRKSTSYIVITKMKRQNNYTPEITLARAIIYPNNGQTILESIAHEVLHAILSVTNRNKHENEFQKCVKILNKILNINIEINTLNNNFKKEAYNYTVYCPECGKVIKEFMKWCPALERLTTKRHLCNKEKLPYLRVKTILPNKQILTIHTYTN